MTQTYVVAKNTLLRIAAKNAGVTTFDDQLVGPSALAFVHGDPVATAKALKDFAKANPLLLIKSAVMDGIDLDAAEINKLTDLETPEVLLAKVASAIRQRCSRPPTPSTHYLPGQFALSTHCVKSKSPTNTQTK